MKSKFLTAGLFVLLLSTVSFSQVKDSSDWFDWDEWNDFEVDFKSGDQAPYISVSYGMSENSHFGLPNKLANTGFIEGKLGYANINKKFGKSKLEDESGLFFGRYSYDLGNKTTDLSEIQTKAWKFGFEGTSGVP
jgi:hypothetical protein